MDTGATGVSDTSWVDTNTDTSWVDTAPDTNTDTSWVDTATDTSWVDTAPDTSTDTGWWWDSDTDTPTGTGWWWDSDTDTGFGSDTGGCPDGWDGFGWLSQVPDCNGDCGPVDWIGDQLCDDGAWGVDFDCSDFSYDMGDCLQDSGDTGGCPDTWDGFDWLSQVPDCNGDCGPVAWIGDTYCDDGSWGADFDCTTFNDDEGDCELDTGTFGVDTGFWLPSDSGWWQSDSGWWQPDSGGWSSDSGFSSGP